MTPQEFDVIRAAIKSAYPTFNIIRTMLPQGMARLLVYPVVRYIVPIIIK